MAEERRLHVIHVCSSLAAASGGMARAVLASAEAVAAGGAKVDVLSYETGEVDWPWGKVLPTNLNVFMFPSLGREHFASGEMMGKLGELMGERGTVLHLHGLWEPLTASAAKLARGRGVPYVCSVHGMLDPWSVRQSAMKKRVYFALVEKRRLARAAALHFTAEQELVKAGSWVPAGPKRLVIPVLMDLRPFEALPAREAAHGFFAAVPAEKPWVLFLSRIHEKKGLDLLIDAVGRLRDKGVQLVVAGQGDEGYVRVMKERAVAAGIGERTHFVGLVQGEKKVALLRRAEVLAIPSSQENFGIVFPEALACGVPVLLTEGVDIWRELVASGGALVVKREAGDIAEKIEGLLGDPAGSRGRGEAGRRWVFETLAAGGIARRWREAYEEMVGIEK